MCFALWYQRSLLPIWTKEPLDRYYLFHQQKRPWYTNREHISSIKKQSHRYSATYRLLFATEMYIRIKTRNSRITKKTH